MKKEKLIEELNQLPEKADLFISINSGMQNTIIGEDITILCNKVNPNHFMLKGIIDNSLGEYLTPLVMTIFTNYLCYSKDNNSIYFINEEGLRISKDFMIKGGELDYLEVYELCSEWLKENVHLFFGWRENGISTNTKKYN